MAYFTAVLTRSGRSWRARDVELDAAQSLDELADCLRGATADDEPVVAVVEHEDEWFALVRVDGEDEPRLFVSDLGAATRSHYGPVLASAADVDVEEDLVEREGEGDEEDGDGDGDTEEEPAPVAPEVRTWAGDPELLDDLGVSGRTLRKLVEGNADDPGAVLAEVGETVGFAELLEALR